MKEMRKALKENLVSLNCPPPKGLNSWNHITDQIGMFCFTGLTVPQAEALVNKYDIFLTKNGRISVSGLNTKNVRYVAESFKEVITKY
jgi:aspartate/tyrosine/aromatic aminotransferase